MRPGSSIASSLGFWILPVFLLLIAADPGWSEIPRTIKIVVPQAAGGAADAIARMFSEQLGRSEGRTVIVENRPGAGSVIGTEAVTRAAPDGSTLLINAPDILIGPQLRKLSYHPLTSLDPICYLVRSPGIIVVNSASRYQTLVDLIDDARFKPSELTMAGAGAATAKHLGVAKLNYATGADFTYVPYGGGAPAIGALLGGHVTSVFTEYAPLAANLKAGTLRALATTSRIRLEQMPDLPTVEEAGYKDFEVDLWWGLFTAPKTSRQAVAQLANWFSTAMSAPEIKTKFYAQGFSPVATCGSDFGALLRKQYDEYSRFIREGNIKAE
jgi:tripartite-type tricarboxylate transporter receptor subunit TctC